MHINHFVNCAYNNLPAIFHWQSSMAAEHLIFSSLDRRLFVTSLKSRLDHLEN